MRTVIVHRPEGPIRARVRLPRSKSVANRALVAASLAGDLTCVREPGDAEDTTTLQHLLRERPLLMDCGMGGTTLRFLLAWAAVQEGEEHVITGAPRLLERPHDLLEQALRELGADIIRTAQGYHVRGKRLAGGRVTLRAALSSQYLSALMLVGPAMRNGLHIVREGRQLSRPYVDMTARVMTHFGADVRVDDDAVDVRAGAYRATPIMVPFDWSAAAFWAEVAALAPDAQLELMGLQADGWQGDQAVLGHLAPWVDVIEREGSTHLYGWPDPVRVLPTTIDLSDTPDLFQPLAATYAARGVEAHFTGLDNLPLKETDRLSAMAEALKAFGVQVSRSEGAFTVLGGPPTTELQRDRPFDPHGDHRMAMALAPLALMSEQVTITDADVVAKSYPGLWDELRAAGFGISYA